MCPTTHGDASMSAMQGIVSHSAHHQPAMLALAFGEPPRPHPVIGPAEQRRIVIIDMLVAHEGAQQLLRLERALGVRGNVVRIFVEIAVDQIDRRILGIVIGLALLGGEIGRYHLAAAIERSRDDVGTLP